VGQLAARRQFHHQSSIKASKMVSLQQVIHHPSSLVAQVSIGTVNFVIAVTSKSTVIFLNGRIASQYSQTGLHKSSANKVPKLHYTLQCRELFRIAIEKIGVNFMIHFVQWFITTQI
jgi:hypothetical protein